jgi:hypothetical protein
MHSNLKLSAISFAIAALVAACGGGGSPQGSAGPTVSVTGAAIKGPISNATVCFYELLTTGKGAQLACTNTTADGNYSINLKYAGGVFVEAAGGSYIDETTGLNTSLASPLTSVGMINGNNSVVVATPLTTLAVNQAMGNLTTVSFGAAAANIGSSFGVTGSISTTIPNVAIGANSSYGEALVGISKMISGGADLSSILRSTNLTELQNIHNITQQCIVAADPTAAGSTPQFAGVFQASANQGLVTITKGASALTGANSRVKPADASINTGVSFVTGTPSDNGTISIVTGSVAGSSLGLASGNASNSLNLSIVGTSSITSGLLMSGNNNIINGGAGSGISTYSGINGSSSGNLSVFSGNNSTGTAGFIYSTSNKSSGAFINIGNKTYSGSISSNSAVSGVAINLLNASTNSSMGGDLTVGAATNTNGLNNLQNISTSVYGPNFTSVGTGVINIGNTIGMQAISLNALSHSSISDVNINLNTTPSQTTLITATEPTKLWRDLITAAGTSAMGCTVTKNTPHQVILNCSATALSAGNLGLYSGLWLASVPPIAALPQTGVIVTAKRIDIKGSLLSPLELTFNNTCVR